MTALVAEAVGVFDVFHESSNSCCVFSRIKNIRMCVIIVTLRLAGCTAGMQTAFFW